MNCQWSNAPVRWNPKKSLIYESLNIGLKCWNHWVKKQLPNKCFTAWEEIKLYPYISIRNVSLCLALVARDAILLHLSNSFSKFFYYFQNFGPLHYVVKLPIVPWDSVNNNTRNYLFWIGQLLYYFYR